MGSALDKSLEEWRRFLKGSAPGRRFSDRYRRRRHSDHERSVLGRTYYASLGITIAIGSLVLAPLPGPGWGTFFVGLGMVSGEVLRLARFLDRIEVELRRLLRGARVLWGKSALAGRTLIALSISLGAATSAYAAYLVSSCLLKIPFS